MSAYPFLFLVVGVKLPESGVLGVWGYPPVKPPERWLNCGHVYANIHRSTGQLDM